MAKGKLKAKIKKIEAKHPLKNVGKKIVAAAKKATVKVADLGFAPLIPFKGMMIKALDKAKVKHGNDISEISVKFAENIAKSKLHKFEDLESSLTNPYVGHSFDSDNEQHIVADIAISVVREVLAYIKKLKEKKDKGEPLTPDEAETLAESTKVADQITDVAKEQSESTISDKIKDFVFSWKGGVALGVLILLIIVAVRRA